MITSNWCHLRYYVSTRFCSVLVFGVSFFLNSCSSQTGLTITSSRVDGKDNLTIIDTVRVDSLALFRINGHPIATRVQNLELFAKMKINEVIRSDSVYWLTSSAKEAMVIFAACLQGESYAQIRDLSVRALNYSDTIFHPSGLSYTIVIPSERSQSYLVMQAPGQLLNTYISYMKFEGRPPDFRKIRSNAPVRVLMPLFEN